MPRPQEIITSIKRRRSMLYRSKRDRPLSWCKYIEYLVVANLPRAHIWKSTVPKDPELDYQKHYVGVVGTRRRRGIIVQFSGANAADTDIVLGGVADIHDEAEVTKVLELKTGRKGWKQLY